MDDRDASSSKIMAKGKRKLQTRKGSKLLQLQAKADSDSESDTGTGKNNFILKVSYSSFIRLEIILIIFFVFCLLIISNSFSAHNIDSSIDSNVEIKACEHIHKLHCFLYNI